APAMVAVVVEPRVQLEPTTLGRAPEARGSRQVVAGRADRDCTAGEFRLPGHRLVDFRELDRIGLGLDARDQNGLLAGEIPRSLQGVDPDIHQSSAAGKSVLEAPLAGLADGDVELRLDESQGTELALARDAHTLEIVDVELAAVGHGELHFRGLAGVDHLPALLDRRLHGFLADDVLAGGRRLECLVGVLGVGRDDVDDIDVPVVGEPIHRVVAVHVGGGNPYFACHWRALSGLSVMSPVSRQCSVFRSAGAIWCSLRLPSPQMAKPSLRAGALARDAAAAFPTSGAAAAAVTPTTNSRREGLSTCETPSRA